MVTMEQKVKAFARIEVKGMSAEEVADVYGVSRSTAYGWKSLVQTNQPPPPNAGRPKTFGEASVKAWHEVLDEAQNATTMQMKMFLTRMGEGSRMAITGDTSQIDLPRGVPSGLIEAKHVLRKVKGIGFTEFDASDVVRHPMVAKIIRAYDANKKEK